MRITLLNSLYPPRSLGGAERSVRGLAEGLVRRGHDVAVISTRPGWTGQRREQGGVRIYELGLRNVYWPFSDEGSPALLKPLWHLIDERNAWMMRTVGRYLQREDPDVLHTNNLAGFSVGVWKVAERLGLRVVHTVRDYYLLCVRASLFRGGRICEKRCLECRISSRPKTGVSGLVHRVVGVSRHVLDVHRIYGFFSDVPDGVIHNEAPPIVDGSDDFPEDGEPLKIGYLGRVYPTKGLEVLLSAVRSMPPGSVEVEIGGEGPPEYVAGLKRDFGGRGVRFLGAVEPSEFLDGLHVLVLPAVWREPFGRVIHEAYAHGVPVVGSARGGIPEAIQGGRTGYVFDPDEPERLMDVLERIRQDPQAWRRMRDACLQQAGRWQQDDVTGLYVDVYERALR